MQTFLPYPCYVKSAKVLDDKRLGKQRSESVIILKTLLGVYVEEDKIGWPHHTATRMWEGHEDSLLEYTLRVCDEWRSRGYKDKTKEYLVAQIQPLIREKYGERPVTHPKWLGDYNLHQSHRSNLLRKYPQHYRKYWPDVPASLPYVWPSKPVQPHLWERHEHRTEKLSHFPAGSLSVGLLELASGEDGADFRKRKTRHAPRGRWMVDGERVGAAKVWHLGMDPEV